MRLPITVSLCLLVAAFFGAPTPVAADAHRGRVATHRRVAGSSRVALTAALLHPETKATHKIRPRAAGTHAIPGPTCDGL